MIHESEIFISLDIFFPYFVIRELYEVVDFLTNKSSKIFKITFLLKIIF